MNNVPCTCGHSRKVHKLVTYAAEGHLICMCKGNSTLVDDCRCYEYKPDNLKYLEDRYETNYK